LCPVGFEHVGIGDAEDDKENVMKQKLLFGLLALSMAVAVPTLADARGGGGHGGGHGGGGWHGGGGFRGGGFGLGIYPGYYGAYGGYGCSRLVRTPYGWRRVYTCY
jgi:hypothetical protein